MDVMWQVIRIRFLVLGVYFDKNLKSKPWFASVTKNRKSHYGGHFATKEEAFIASCAIRIKLHGEFVRHGSFI